jgi:hypothetical protein
VVIVAREGNEIPLAFAVKLFCLPLSDLYSFFIACFKLSPFIF